jgi:3-hydroxybutyryl-CoA dehydrogenase
MADYQSTAILGAGVIGANWAALFLASGRHVAVYDPAPDAEATVKQYVENAWPVLTQLGLTANGNPDNVSFHRDPRDAVANASFIQESVPERIDVKHALYQQIEDALDAEAVIASSASGLTLSEMQGGFANPAQLILGHPFNPPHLIPLVEVMGNDKTGAGVVEKAEDFYKQVGKVTIRVNKEVPGHVANRLQAAVWREAIHMINSGVASVEDVDKAMWAGPGLRWAVMGPTMLFHLGAGEGGLTEFCERYTPSFNRWWDDLGELHLNPEIAAQLVDGVEQEAGGQSAAELSTSRDEMLAAILSTTGPLRKTR